MPSAAYFIVPLCIIASSVEPIVAKMCYTSMFIAPLALMAVKFVSGGILSIPSFIIRKKCLNAGNFLKVIPLGILLFVTGACVLFALNDLSASMVITIITTTPAFVAFVNSSRGRAKLGHTFWVGFFLCFLGIVLTLNLPLFSATSEIAAPPDVKSLRGAALAFLSVFLSTAYRTRLEVVTETLPSSAVSAWMFVISGLLGLLLFPFVGELDLRGVLFGVFLGFAGVCANITFVKSVQLIGSTRMSVITLIQRPLVIFLAALLLKEPLSAVQVAGIVMVIAGISLARVEQVSSK